ncbi:MAG: hypothetical protein R3F19_02960 [Verrucomicrobiales bacterium]
MSRPKANPADGSSAFTTAATVLGLIALAQVAAVAWFVTQYEPENGEPNGSTSTIASSASLGSPGTNIISAPEAAVNEAPRIARTHAVANIPTIDPGTVTPPAVDETGDGVDEEIPIQNKAALYYLDQGMMLRADGDMQGALVHFNSAASLEKDHPRILYEFAITYEEMGLSAKAANFWKSIYQMGPVRGGDYYSLADFRLKGQAPEARDEYLLPDLSGELASATPPVADPLPVTPAAKVAPVRKILKIGSAIAEPDKTVAEGERVVLNVLIQSTPGVTINPEYVHVRVDFYDVVNEDMVDLTRAVPANRWVTQPVNWQNQSEELLEVTYFLPPQADQEILDFGHRAYHGYVVKVYYHDQLQDAVAEPVTLLDSTDLSTSLQTTSEPPVDDDFFPR